MAFTRGFNIRNLPPLNVDELSKLYDSITPIRGTQIRPLGDRRRKHEQLVKLDADTYAFKFYNTHCVEVKRDGRIILRTGGYNTSSTATFISEIIISKTGQYITKCFGQLWIKLQGADSEAIPLRYENEFRLIDNALVPTAPLEYPVYKIDRDKSKVIRNALKPFLGWVKPMLALSDNRIMATTMIEANDKSREEAKRSEPYIIREYALEFNRVKQLWHDVNYTSMSVEDIVKKFGRLTDDMYMQLLCLIAIKTGFRSNSLSGDPVFAHIADHFISCDDVKDYLYRRLITNNTQARTTATVQATQFMARGVAI